MNKHLFFSLIFIFFMGLTNSSMAQSQSFNQFFTQEQLRVDFSLAGNHESKQAYWVQTKKEHFYGGSLVNTVDPFGYGEYRFRLFDAASDSLIYSRGFSTLFEEWQRQPEAKERYKAFQQSIVMPYPKAPVKLVVEAREFKDGKFYPMMDLDIDPSDFMIKEAALPEYPVRDLQVFGTPSKKLDIVVVSEGYEEDEMRKFRADAARLFEYFFTVEPFKSRKQMFNIRLVEIPSNDSGTDIPGDNIWSDTPFKSHFYTFRSERYLTTSDVWDLRDVCATVPYDQIVILVNTEKYGGGGIYNHYNILSSDHELSAPVLVHEFGHGFAGLGDEYAYGEEDFFNKKTEPWPANITTLVDFESKWKDMVAEEIPIPTPESDTYKNAVGVYEGAGYSLKGIYRPVQDCRMRSNSPDSFCPVCSKALLELLEWNCE